jgi:transposase-like protein/Zn ribbon nucleic-acid-binding protein
MSDEHNDDLWRDFPKTAIEFEQRFATEEDCRAYWIEARWAGRPACAKCRSRRVWSERGGRLFECAECGHQTSLTSGTLLEKTTKPLKMWFRAVFEISSRKNGISAKELQRIMGFGSYETAWTWLHKLRAALVRPNRQPLAKNVQIDEAFVGAKRAGKSLVLVATETDGRVRMAQADNNDAETCKRFADAEVAPDAAVTTDGHKGYSAKSLGARPHERKVQTKAGRAEADALQATHWAISLLKRWLFGTHGSAVSHKHLQAYLDEYVFRYNRRSTKGVGRIAARTIEQLVVHAPLTLRQIVDDTLPYRRLTPVSAS